MGRPGLFFLALLLALSGCKDDGPQARSEPPHLSLPTTVVASATVPDVYSVPGTVVSDDRIEMSSRVVGFIKTLEVREGQHVAKGQLLVEIDPSDIDEAIRQAEASVLTARKDLADAEHDVDKYNGLVEKGAATAEVARKAAVRRDIAQATLTRAEAARASAEVQRTYASIVSPVDGVVVIRHRHSGDLATAGTPILTIESRQLLLFKVFVAESSLARITPDMAVSVKIDALDSTVEGRVRRIVPSGDPLTRRFEVTITLPPDPRLMPGLFGRAEFIVGSASAAFIPVRAKVQRGGLDGVFVVGADRVARFRWLRFGRERNGLVEVTAGLSPGETIVTRADQAMRDGAIVTATCTENGCGKPDGIHD